MMANVARITMGGHTSPHPAKFLSPRTAGSCLRSGTRITRPISTCTAPGARQCAALQLPSRVQQRRRLHPSALRAHSVEAGLQAAPAPAAAAAAAGGSSSKAAQELASAVDAAAASQLVGAAAALQADSDAGEAADASPTQQSSEDAQAEGEQARIEVELVIRPVSSQSELQAVANLRAEAYFADDHSRFAASFKRQFAAQEIESLRVRTAPTSSSGRPQLCDCLVALGGPRQEVLGCIDIRLPASATGQRAVGVPEDDAGGCYLLNVVVDDAWRGQGIGRQLMRAAMQRAVHTWGAERLYTHVEADNEIAASLYMGCGFAEHSAEARLANTLALGRLVLLMASAEQVPAAAADTAAGAASSSSSSSSSAEDAAQ